MPADWLRGPTWIDGDDIVMSVVDATPYRMLAESDVGLELARVRTPAEALEFARRFGLLRASPSGRSMSLKVDPKSPLREPVALFETTAEDLRYVLDTIVLVRRGNQGDVTAVRELRRRLVIPEDADVSVRDPATDRYVTRRAGDVYSPRERFVGADERTILTYASEHAAQIVNDGLWSESPVNVYDRAFASESVPPGSWRVGTSPDTLATACYLSVALVLAEQRPIGICEDETCRRVFFIEDGRQRFCTAACANRARYRRYRQRQQEGE